LYRPNPATVLIVTFTGRRDPYLSLGFFVIALGCPAFIIRQQRYLPPPERHRV
jgi:hypothetical protein